MMLRTLLLGGLLLALAACSAPNNDAAYWGGVAKEIRKW